MSPTAVFVAHVTQRITCKTKLERSRKRLSSCNPATLQEHESPAKFRRMTRETSVSLLANFPTRNEHVLPLVCIICPRDKYEKNNNNNNNNKSARAKVKLVTCEGDGQKLLELAERRHAEKILLHMRVRACLLYTSPSPRDMTIPLQFASLYHGQEIFVWSNACWILARASSLVTWSLYEMCSILK